MTEYYNLEWLTERNERGDTLKFLYFWGHEKTNDQAVGNYCLSQWFECPFVINNLTYKTAEHWMMAQKALMFNDRESFEKIVKCDTPKEAKLLGRQVSGFDKKIWEDNRFRIVKFGNIHKFNQNRAYGEYLLQTGSKILVEASPVDTIWGVGLAKESNQIGDINAWRGLNLMGFALMEARDFLNEFGFFTELDNGLAAPWIKYPEICIKHEFWATSEGEEFLNNFCKTFEQLTDKEKTIFKLTNPTPYPWRGFYC
ncbi:NADAR family protein [Puteibacter caeruleilacunae]|nr:NADAR family protein [Puteibacter caeruleilacunae]